MVENVCKLINIEKNYKNKEIIKGFNLTVRKGEMVAITGKSGSGKTTILNIIGMLEKPDSGTLELFSCLQPIKGNKKNKLLRERISYLFQNFALIDNTDVNQNLEVPLIYSKKSKKEKQKIKEEALIRVGLNISLKQNIHELSGGEQQRVALARLLLKPSDLILADEPTGSLDAKNRDEIMGLLREINNEGKTIILVTHDMAVSNICDRIISLS